MIIAPICEHDVHLCPACEVGKPCMDLFQDARCGLVACTSPDDPDSEVIDGA